MQECWFHRGGTELTEFYIFKILRVLRASVVNTPSDLCLGAQDIIHSVDIHHPVATVNGRQHTF